MSEKEEQKRLLSDLSVDDSIFRCGELQISIEDTCRLLSERTDPYVLMKELKNPRSHSYSLYHNGVAEGNLKLNIDLEYNVSNPKAKDAYKNLSAERKRQAVNKKLEEMFGEQ